MSVRILPLLLLAGFLVACGASAAPKVKVLGVSEHAARNHAEPASRSTHLLVYLEVVNPTARNLELSRFQYAFLSAGTKRGSGDISLSRELSAQSAAVVEVPVELFSDTDGEFSLEGKLYAVDDKVIRSWKVVATGSLARGLGLRIEPDTEVPVGVDPAQRAPAAAVTEAAHGASVAPHAE